MPPTAAGGVLLPGTFVRAEVRGPVYPDRILVPRGAFREGRVLVVEQAKARARSVTPQLFIEDRAMISGDLRSGDRVILSHLDKLADGSPVRIRAEEPLPDGRGTDRPGLADGQGRPAAGGLPAGSR